jgi:hypothetical protein
MAGIVKMISINAPNLIDIPLKMRRLPIVIKDKADKKARIVRV